ncbi:MAG: SUMF1/EgtB/PvdO family nonheme iron enzyme [Candidatus Neomarinimicrobiota bacterium]
MVKTIRHRPQLLPIEMIAISGGTFLMGDFNQGKDEDALPLHPVTLPDFLISKYEITYDQYDRYASLNGLKLPEDNSEGRSERAVVNITWDEAREFCECNGMRLPTEPEWEYAARSAGQDQVYPGTNYLFEVGEYIRHLDNSVQYSFYVGSKKPNLSGIFDMGGNVYEWIGNYYHQYPDPGNVPIWADFSTDRMRIIRGGSFKTGAVANYSRVATFCDQRSTMIGFRCVKPVR